MSGEWGDDASSIDASLRAYFAANGFAEDGGYSARWVVIKVGPLPLAFPNTQARVRAVRFHDLHHVATGFSTDLAGEAEISAWEIAGGCADHYAAWLLNLIAMAAGLFFAPRAVLRAFIWGRQTRNLYREDYDEVRRLDSVGALRRSLHLDRPRRGGAISDSLRFAFWSLCALAVIVLQFAVVALPIAGLIWLLS
jgi:hypothetical protein